ncbi:uncharacterized protein ColSpa_03267 [Colletotrichum spaethianum]|uniref:Uncharacterized protein n=1 Tax=Colletotrichum spaethianum TaxID=700344 RepID=A0AA37P579_9PEZI|nr:uncharacterized protein ColSpa_03267 [Colletotrichum spaethianum]GKT43086.1 hypothetical protein ColSpa_03267 [Colletotrichum spaethianum]
MDDDYNRPQQRNKVKGGETRTGETRHKTLPQAVVQGPPPTVRIGNRTASPGHRQKCAEYPQPAWLRLIQPHSFLNWHGARGETKKCARRRIEDTEQED